MTSLGQLRQRYERPSSRYVVVDGVRLHYHDEGSGDAVVFIHGSHSTLRTWDPVVERLVDSMRCVRWDQPHVGLSEALAPTEAATALSMLSGLLNHLGIDRVAIVATSSGGTLATEFAACHPDRVAGLAIANAPPDPVEVGVIPRSASVRLARLVADRIVGRRPLWFWWLYLRSLWGKPSRLRPALVREFRDFGNAPRSPVPDRLIPLNRSVAAATQRLGRVRCPVLLVWGLRDYVLPPATVEVYAERLAAASVRVVRLPDVGHYPPIEVPDEFAEQVAPFVREVLARG